ncbi:MAG: cyclic nucleotide-binding domain-containing protein, partial [Acidimicrobiales bacterium]
TPGQKTCAIWWDCSGGTVVVVFERGLVVGLCLDDYRLERLSALAGRCEEVYGAGRDIEWAYADGQLYLLQCRAVTRVGSSRPSVPVAEQAAEVITQVPLFAGLSAQDVAQIGAMFKERTFSAGETITKEGAGAAAFFVIESGEATVSVHGEHIATLARGDFFGEVALIDEGARSATVTASSELVCYGLTFWEFRPLVQHNATIAWNLLQTFARRLRSAQEA